MQRELYEVEKDRFDLKDSSVYHLQGTWPKDYKAEAVLDGEPLSVVISAQEIGRAHVYLHQWNRGCPCKGSECHEP